MVVNSPEEPEQVASDREMFTPLTDRELLGSMYRMVIAAILIPPFVGGLVATAADFYPFPGFFYGLADITGVYVAVFLTMALLIVPCMHRTIVSLANSRTPVTPEFASRTLFRFNTSLWLGICIYTVFGVISADYTMERLGYRQYNLSDHVRSQIIVFPVVMLSSFPIFFIISDKIGCYLAPRGILPLVVSLRTKVLILGIFSPLLIDTILIGYFYNQTGYFSFRTMGIWLMLLCVAIIGAYVAWRSLKQGIQPLNNYTRQNAGLELGPVYEEIVPTSLDEFGMLTANLNTLEKRRFELTKKNARRARIFQYVTGNHGERGYRAEPGWEH